jgi:hypothetical protein
MRASAKSCRAAFAECSPSHAVITLRPRNVAGSDAATASITARAASSGCASAVGQLSTRMASTSGSRINAASASAYRLPGASPMMSTGLPRLQVEGKSRFKSAIVCSDNAASRPSAAIRASVARTPAPPPLVRIASRSPTCSRVSAKVSAASNSSAIVSTRSIPARRNAAS